MSNRNFIPPCHRAAALCIVFWSLDWAVHCFQIPLFHPTPRQVRVSLVHPSLRTTILRSTNEIVDVEFERSPEDEDDQSPKTKTTTTPSRGKKKKKRHSTPPSSLFELSLESDPRWKDARIPFVDLESSTSIDCTVAFVVELEGVQYGIAVPSDAAAAITVEDPKDKSVINLYPDDDDNVELMEIMAAQLVEHVGKDLSLKRTPRVLTIAGDLDQYTDNWQDELLPAPTPVKDFLEIKEEEDDLAWAHEFFKRELGEVEYRKIMDAPTTAESIGDEMMELFEVPGMGENDFKEFEEMIRSLNEEEDPMEGAVERLGGDPLDHEGAALKLIGFNFKDGKAYSLVRLLKPYTLVGRLSQDSEALQFELLTKEEEKLAIPKLEELCRKDLEEAGLYLTP